MFPAPETYLKFRSFFAQKSQKWHFSSAYYSTTNRNILILFFRYGEKRLSTLTHQYILFYYWWKIYRKKLLKKSPNSVDKNWKVKIDLSFLAKKKSKLKCSFLLFFRKKTFQIQHIQKLALQLRNWAKLFQQRKKSIPEV